MTDLEKLLIALIVNGITLFASYAEATYGNENAQWFWCELLGAKGVCS